MIFEELIGTLMHCQIIGVDNELYNILAEIDTEDWIYLVESLNSAGYGISFNNNEDCYVVY